MKRKLLMGLVMALALSLSACGGSESTGSEGTENVTQGESVSDGDNK